jgi:hypothetical protein
MTDSKLHQMLSAAVVRVLRPLVRLLIRNGMSYGSFADLSKRVFVDIADKDFSIEGKKQTVSRVSVITGLSRKEVARVQSLPVVADDTAQQEQYNRAARIISGWVNDEDYQDDQGQPALLPVEGSEISFASLVKKYSGDVPVRALLDELLRVGAVLKQDNKMLTLKERAYVPRAGDLENVAILGVDVAGLLNTIDNNLQPEQKQALFQRKVYYDNLPEEALEELRAMTREHGQVLLEKLNKWMVQQDRDTSDKKNGTGRFAAGVGVYLFEERIDEEAK